MPHWPRLEATDSIIEVLWDVALLVFAIRLALIYAALTFAASSILFTLFFLAFSQTLPSSDNTNITTNTYTTTDTNPFTTHPHAAPLLALAAAASSAHAVIRRYDIPRVLAFRLAVGVGAGVVVGALAGLVWLVECEVLGGREGMAVLVGEVLGGWKNAVGVLGGLVLMPVAMMGWGRWGEKGVGVVRRRRGEGEKGGR
ncbi:uncharacterized protein B0H64DRAFT_381034 [Chaetomium fimeti]|uniref:Uncharacterized protein n=1 Tax=Chaetomium fimeti TaxID=1854472 RepID=A0AAE0HPW7_9PEZI|nr:hypothetical protein B0H64DRAFT_381034 [Chaetomium fimeti]